MRKEIDLREDVSNSIRVSFILSGRFIEIWSAIGSRLGENRGLCLASQIWIVVVCRGQLIESAIVEQIAIESGNDADFGNDGRFESVIGGLASAIGIASGSENHPQ